MNTPKPPTHLSRESKALWRSIVADFNLERHHLNLLENLCTQLDRARAARKLIEAEGELVQNRFGEWKANPACGIERDATTLAVRIQRELGLDFEGGPIEAPRPPKAVGTEGRR